MILSSNARFLSKLLYIRQALTVLHSNFKGTDQPAHPDILIGAIVLLLINAPDPFRLASELRLRLAPWNQFKLSSKSILLTIPRRFGSFLLVMLHVSVCCYLWCLFLVALWSPAGKELTSWLSCLLCFVTFPNVPWSTLEFRARLSP